MKSIYILFVIPILFFGCGLSPKQIEFSEKQNKDIDSILITYFCGYIDTETAIKCEKLATIQVNHPINNYSLINEGIIELIDTFIVDKTILNKIPPLLDKKKNTENYEEDARMYVTIKYLNNTTDYICIGMDGSQIIFNGKCVVVENELVYLLRKFSGYYQWFNKDILEDFEEYH